MSPRLVLTDLDGTLLGESLQIDPRDAAAVARATAAGNWIGVASGRMYRSALPHALALHANLPLVCYQGALIQELPSSPGAVKGEMIFESAVPHGLALEILELCHRRDYTLNVYQDDHLYVEELNQDTDFYTGIAQVEAEVDPSVPLEERVRRGTTKVTVVSRDERRFNTALSELRELVGGRAEVTRSVVGFCEITALGVNKGRALGLLCSRLGISPADTVALGDAPNDLPMLEAAGVAVAVESGSEETRARADWLVPGPGGAGLAELIARLELDRPVEQLSR